jgi:hypothetical protein
MVAIPGEIPSITPALLIDTLVASVVVQVPPLVEEVSVDDVPTQRDALPVIVPAVRGAVTIIAKVEDALEQPPDPLTV